MRCVHWTACINTCCNLDVRLSMNNIPGGSLALVDHRHLGSSACFACAGAPRQGVSVRPHMATLNLGPPWGLDLGARPGGSSAASS